MAHLGRYSFTDLTKVKVKDENLIIRWTKKNFELPILLFGYSTLVNHEF